MANGEGDLMRHRGEQLAVLLIERAPPPRAEEDRAKRLTFGREGRGRRGEQAAAGVCAQVWRHDRLACGKCLLNQLKPQAKARVTDVCPQLTACVAGPHLARRIEKEQPAGLRLPARGRDVKHLAGQLTDLVTRDGRRCLGGAVERMQRAHLTSAGAQALQRGRDGGAQDIEQTHMVFGRAIC